MNTLSGERISELCENIARDVPSSEVDQARQLSEIAWAVGILQTARSRILQHTNSRLPVARLPAELLTKIFSFCLPVPDLDVLFPRYGQKDDVNPGVFAFSQVSRSWRTVALDAPQLWTTPLLRWPALAVETIRRTKDVPLNVIYVHRPSSPTSYEAVLSQVAQRPVRMVVLRVPDRLLSNFITKMVSRSAHLEVLHLTLNDHNSTRVPSLDLSSLSTEAPYLRDLALTECNLMCNSGTPFLGLTEVYLCAAKNQPSFSLDCLLDFLASTPALESLHLSRTFQMDSFRSPSKKREGIPIPLVHLQALYLSEDWFGASVLMSRLQLCSGLALHIASLNMSFVPNADYESLLTLLGTHPSIFRAPILSEFSVIWNPQDQIFLTGHIDETNDDYFVANFRYAVGAAHPSSIVSVLSRAMPLRDISVLSVHHLASSNHAPPTMEDWQRLLHACPRLTDLYSGGGASASLAIFLGQPGLRKTWDGTHLEKLVFEETNVQEQAAHDGRPLLEHLRNFALTRVESAPACSVLGFTRCMGMPTAEETKAQFGAFFDRIKIRRRG